MISEARLEGMLTDLAQDVVWPATPNVAPAVLERLVMPPPGAWRLRRAWRPAFAIAVVATFLLAAAVAALAFGLPGLRIIFTESLPPSAIAPAPGERLGLGDATTLEAAAASFGGGLAVPAAIGAPDETYAAADGSIVSLVYHAADGLPALADSDIGLLVMEVHGRVDPEHLEKLVLEGHNTVTVVDVVGVPGYWIEGGPHVLRYRDPSGETGEIVTRLVGDTLVWERDGVLYRIESALGFEETLRIAESMQDAP
jgi:hypothetical protein